MNSTQQSQQGTRPPLRRPQQGRVVAGVSAGVAANIGTAPWVVRVAFIVLTFFGGFGVLLYLIAWLLMPEEGQDTPIAGSLFRDVDGLTNWLGIGLIVAAGLVVLSWTDVVSGEFLIAAALLGIGVLLFRGDIGRSSEPTATPGEAAANDAADDAGLGAATALDEPVGDDAPAEQPPEAKPPVVVAAPPPPRPKPPKSILGRLTFAAALLTLGIMAALDAANLTQPAFSHYIAAVVIVAGVGLLVGALWGKSYGLIALGLVLLPVLALTTLVRVPFGGEIGEQVNRPVIVSGTASYEMAIGEMRVDLRDLARGEPVAINADLGIGELVVIVPVDRPAVIKTEIGIGAIEVPGDQHGGLGLEETYVVAGDGEGDVVTVTADAGIGLIRVLVTEP